MSNTQRMSASASASHSQGEIEISSRLGVARPQSQDFAKLRDSRIEQACVAEGLAETEAPFNEFRPDFKRAPVFGDGCVARTGFLEQSREIVPRFHIARVESHGPARVPQRL